MKSFRKLFFLFIGIVIIIVLTRYYSSYWYDLSESPWAYSRNPQEQLLIGKWQGDFADPDGVKKHIDLTILIPTTNEERWESAFTFHKKTHRYSRNKDAFFEGLATVKSKLGTEEYEISGHVQEDDIHQLFIHFSTPDDKKKVLPNFTLFEAKKGLWEGDKMTLTLQFSYQKANGSSFWSSSIPKYSAKINCGLFRVN